MFLVLCNEAFGYTHVETLDSSLSLILGMLREHGFLANERNKALYSDDDGSGEDSGGEWVEMIDFETGQLKKVRKKQTI